MVTIIVILLLLVIFGITFKMSVKNSADELYKEVFKEKKLPIRATLPFYKGNRKIYLYDLNKNKDGSLDRLDLTYARIAKMINKDLEVKVVDGELIIEIPDYTKKEYKTKVIDIISLVTNFNYAQFVFKGNDKFLLYEVNTDLNTSIKEHAMYIINQVIDDIASIIEEGFGDPQE